MRTYQYSPLWLSTIDFDGSFDPVEKPHRAVNDRGAQND